jgi:hypothetical protein
VNGASKVRRRTIVLDADVLLDKNLNVFSKGQNPITLAAICLCGAAQMGEAAP